MVRTHHQRHSSESGVGKSASLENIYDMDYTAQWKTRRHKSLSNNSCFIRCAKVLRILTGLPVARALNSAQRCRSFGAKRQPKSSVLTKSPGKIPASFTQAALVSDMLVQTSNKRVCRDVAGLLQMVNQKQFHPFTTLLQPACVSDVQETITSNEEHAMTG